MPFSIGEFRSQFELHTSPADFEVVFNAPAVMRALSVNHPNLEETRQTMHFFAKSASIPSKTINTDDKYFMHENQRKIPYGVASEPLSVQFYDRSGMPVRRYFEAWINAVIPQYEAGTFKRFAANYYDEYVTQASVMKYKRFGKERRDRIESSWSFYEIYPISISQIDLDWSATDQMVIFQVDFAYYLYEVGQTWGLAQTNSNNG